jgi:hypothetical protein
MPEVPKSTLSTQDRRLLEKPSLKIARCAVCGLEPSSSWLGLTQHHVVPQGRTVGLENRGPTITLCGSGTTGCHGKAELREIRFDYDDARGLWIARVDELIREFGDNWIDLPVRRAA